MPSLKSTLVSGFKWVMAGNFAVRLLGLATTAVVARRLAPSDFGVFALAFVAIDGLMLFQTLGLNSAIVQRKELTEQAKHTTLVMLVVTGVAVTLVGYLSAPLLADFFNNDSVGPVIQALSALFLIGCLSRIPNALMLRELRFRALSLIDLVGAVFNSLLLISLVLVWPSIWCLVIAALSKQLLISVLLLYHSGYRPRWQFDRRTAGELMEYGRYMMGVGIVTYLWASVDALVIGRMLGTTLLGYFTLAWTLAEMFNRHIAGNIATMMFPAFSKMQGERERLTNAFLQSTRIVAVVGVPFGLALTCLAGPIVLTLYGSNWVPTIALARLLGIGVVIASLTGCVPSLFRACGVPQYDFAIMLGRLVIRFSLLIVFIKIWGLTGAVVAGIVTTAAFTPVALHYARRFAPFSYRDYFRQLLPIFLSGAAMAGAIVLLDAGLERLAPAAVLGSPVAMLAVLSAAGGLVFAGSLWLVDPSLCRELIGMIIKRNQD